MRHLAWTPTSPWPRMAPGDMLTCYFELYVQLGGGIALACPAGTPLLVLTVDPDHRLGTYPKRWHMLKVLVSGRLGDLMHLM